MNKKIKDIIELARLRFLAGGFLLYTLGVLLALNYTAEFSIIHFIFGYAIMMPAHLSLSFSNNYFDIEVDRHYKPTSISGGSKILIENPELIKTCRNIAIGLIFISIILAFVFILVFSYTITFLAFIIFGNLLGWYYTAHPIRLAYRGLGEIANMINMGILMIGIGYWVMNGSLDFFFLLFAIPFLLYGLNFIIIVEIPDMEGDKKAKKNTLVVRLGRKNAYKIMIISLFSASIYFIFIAYMGFFDKYLNFLIIYLLSLIPLLIEILLWFKEPFTKKRAVNIAQINMGAFLLFVILINIYLLTQNIL